MVSKFGCEITLFILNGQIFWQKLMQFYLLKNAAKLHFLFQSTKYLSRNSQILLFFFHFVNSTYHFLYSFDSLLYLIIYNDLAKVMNIWHELREFTRK